MSTYLLDSHTWMWMLTDDRRLGHRTRRIVAAPESTLLLSFASVWELSIKVHSGKLDMPLRTRAQWDEQILMTAVSLTPVDYRHTIAAAALPRHHGDPFDRMLVAQAQDLGVPILTIDPKIARYDVDVIAD